MRNQLIASTLAFCACVSLTTAANAQIYQLDVTSSQGPTNINLGSRTQVDSGTLTGSFLFDSSTNLFSNASFTYDYSFNQTASTATFSGLSTWTPVFRDFDSSSFGMTFTANDSQLFFNFFNESTAPSSPLITSGITELTTDFRFNIYGTSQLTSGDTQATFSVTAVPEPETYAMFLAGLGLLAFARRAKKL